MNNKVGTTLMGKLDRLPYVLKLAILPAYCIFAVGHVLTLIMWETFLQEWVIFRRMKRSGRTIDVNDKRLESGTFLVESVSMSWGQTRLWWTSDNIVENCPHKVPTHQFNACPEEDPEDIKWSPFDRWCTEQYVAPDTGRANLICSKNGIRLLESVQKKHRNKSVVFVFSGGQLFEGVS